MRRLWSCHLRFVGTGKIDFVQLEIVLLIGKRNFFAASKDLMSSILFIPFCHCGVLVHVFNDISPADASVISAETNLAFLSAIRDDAHLSAAEIVVEQILKPHPRNEKKIPAIRAALGDILITAIAAYPAIVFPSQPK